MVHEYNYWCGVKSKKPCNANNIIEFAQIKKDGEQIEKLQNEVAKKQAEIRDLQIEISKIRKWNRVLLIGETLLSAEEQHKKIESLTIEKEKILHRIEVANFQAK